MSLSQDSQAQILINCPQCGGDIGFLEESWEIRCQFCGTSLLVAGREGVLRYALPLRLRNPAEAQEIARSYLLGFGKVSAEPGEPILFYAPFWRLQGQVYRWGFGSKPMKVETEEGAPPPLGKMKTLLTRIMDHTLRVLPRPFRVTAPFILHAPIAESARFIFLLNSKSKLSRARSVSRKPACLWRRSKSRSWRRCEERERRGGRAGRTVGPASAPRVSARIQPPIR